MESALMRFCTERKIVSQNGKLQTSRGRRRWANQHAAFHIVVEALIGEKSKVYVSSVSG